MEAARAARLHARAPYSGFLVGAALEDHSGRIHTGCNVESASYGLTVCAERVAALKAVSEGVHQFRAMVVVADTPVLTPPCGACRQMLWDLCGNITITLVNLAGDTEHFRLSELFPRPFDASFVAAE
jgi:cytidine deaminase